MSKGQVLNLTKEVLGTGAKETTSVVLAEMNEKDLGILSNILTYMPGEEPRKWAFQRVSPGKKEDGDSI